MLPSAGSDGRRRSTAVPKFSSNDRASRPTRLEASDVSIFGEATLYMISGWEFGGRSLFRNAHRTAHLTFVWRIGPCNLLHTHWCFEGHAVPAVCLLLAASPSRMYEPISLTYRKRKDVHDVCCTEVVPAVQGHILWPWLMQTARIVARIGDLVPTAFGVLPDTECRVIGIWYSDSTDTAARSTFVVCSFELHFDHPGKTFAVKGNNLKQPNSLAYFYKISTIMTRLRSGWSVVRIPGGASLFSSSKRPDRLWGSPSLLFNVYRGFILAFYLQIRRNKTPKIFCIGGMMMMMMMMMIMWTLRTLCEWVEL